jgi:thymidylate kinase
MGITTIIKPGTFIVFEGHNKSGKSTQIELLLNKVGGAYVTAIPDPETMTGYFVHEYLNQCNQIGIHNHVITQLLLLLASDHDHYNQIIRLKLAEGHAVIQERHWWTHFANFFVERLDYEMEREQFLFLCGLSMDGIVPDIVFLFRDGDIHENGFGVLKAYRRLAKTPDHRIAIVPKGTEQEIEDFIINELIARKLVYSEEVK